MLEELKKQVFDANIMLVEKGLVIYTWGNVSGIDREHGLVVIKPSGVNYDQMCADDMTVVDLEGNIMEGKYKPSSDTATHLELYKANKTVGGIVHTHSTWAVTFAQAGLSIPAFGTTHADYFYGSIPCTRDLTEREITESYEKNTGKVIVETMGGNDWMAVPAIVVKNHGPFAWGSTPSDSVYHAVVLEKVAEMAYKTMTLNPAVSPVPDFLLDKHYLRKHGSDAYYGQ